MDEDFKVKLESFIAGLQQIENDYKTKNYTNLKPETVEYEVLQKFVRVFKVRAIGNDGEFGRNIVCFVAMEDFHTKALGNVKKGDIYKPSSWKIPAKNRRGTIYSEQNGLESVDSSGHIHYLR